MNARPAGLQADPATALGATLAHSAVAVAADIQSAAVLRVVRHRAAVAHEGHNGVEEIRRLSRKRRKLWLDRRRRGIFAPVSTRPEVAQRASLATPSGGSCDIFPAMTMVTSVRTALTAGPLDDLVIVMKEAIIVLPCSVRKPVCNL